MWFTAHVVMWLRFKDGTQPYYPAEENLLLISAETPALARQAAEDLARARYAGDDDGCLRCDGRPAERVFGAVRHLIECEDAEVRPDHGTEVTYQYLLAESKGDFDDLLAGRDARVLVKERNDPDLA